MTWIILHRDFVLFCLFMTGNYGAFWIGRWTCIKDHYPEIEGYENLDKSLAYWSAGIDPDGHDFALDFRTCPRCIYLLENQTR